MLYGLITAHHKIVLHCFWLSDKISSYCDTIPFKYIWSKDFLHIAVLIYFPRLFLNKFINFPRWDSNVIPWEYETHALPTELARLLSKFISVNRSTIFTNQLEAMLLLTSCETGSLVYSQFSETITLISKQFGFTKSTEMV